jgi:hypothetical protein
MTIRWPEKILPPRDVMFEVAPRSLAGPASVAGHSQVVSSDAGIWKAAFSNIHVRGEQRVLTFRAISVLLEGRLGRILVPFCRGYQPVLTGTEGLYDPVPHSDGTFFSDGSGYVGATVEATLASGIAARSVSAVVNIAYGGTLQPGQHFSIGERGYRLRTVVYVDNNTAAITFRPPLREAASAGTRLEFDDPVVRMKLASDTEMDLELQLRRFGRPTVNFVEDL